jgi:hypothetical protein
MDLGPTTNTSTLKGGCCLPCPPCEDVVVVFSFFLQEKLKTPANAKRKIRNKNLMDDSVQIG